ncbi:MAG: hypothetical protein IH594_16435 [Bacteroidales bacterium]|nr:hypothetical protein [Bacteroidales bacterium]
MGIKAIKQELIEWITQLEDHETIEYLKIVKDSGTSDHDWWDDLSEEQKADIERGLKDIREGRTYSYEEVKKRYGL